MLGAKLFASEFAVIHRITEAQIALAWKVFEHFADKDWSFTDCYKQGCN